MIFYYTQVDKHIRKLDTDLAHFEAELKERSGRKSGEHAADGSNQADSSALQSQMTTSANVLQAVAESSSKRKKKKVEQPAVIM